MKNNNVTQRPNVKKLKSYIKEKHIKLWQIADYLNINQSRLSTELRYDISDERLEELINIADTICKNLMEQYEREDKND